MTKTHTKDRVHLNNVEEVFAGKLVFGAELIAFGFSKPSEISLEIYEKQLNDFWDWDGGVSEIIEYEGKLHIFNRRGNDYFTYHMPFAEWVKDSNARVRNIDIVMKLEGHRDSLCEELHVLEHSIFNDKNMPIPVKELRGIRMNAMRYEIQLLTKRIFELIELDEKGKKNMSDKYRLIIDNKTISSSELVHVADCGFTALLDSSLESRTLSIQLYENDTLLLADLEEFELFFNTHHIQLYMDNDFCARIYYETADGIRFSIYSPYDTGYNKDLEQYLVKSMEKYQAEKNALFVKLNSTKTDN